MASLALLIPGEGSCPKGRRGSYPHICLGAWQQAAWTSWSRTGWGDGLPTFVSPAGDRATGGPDLGFAEEGHYPASWGVLLGRGGESPGRASQGLTLGSHRLRIHNDFEQWALRILEPVLLGAAVQPQGQPEGTRQVVTCTRTW